MSPVIAVIIAVAITLVVSVPVSSYIAVKRHETEEKATVGSAQDKARQIVDEALRTAETKKREALLEAKEES